MAVASSPCINIEQRALRAVYHMFQADCWIYKQPRRHALLFSPLLFSFQSFWSWKIIGSADCEDGTSIVSEGLHIHLRNNFQQFDFGTKTLSRLPLVIFSYSLVYTLLKNIYFDAWFVHYSCFCIMRYRFANVDRFVCLLQKLLKIISRTFAISQAWCSPQPFNIEVLHICIQIKYSSPYLCFF